MARDEKAYSVAAASAALDAESITPAGRAKTRFGWGAFQALGLRIASIFAMLFAWWSMTLFFPPTLVPHPVETLAEVAAIMGTGDFFSEMGATLRRVGVGFGIAMLVSIPLGILMGTVRSLEHFFESPVILGLTMPGKSRRELATFQPL